MELAFIIILTAFCIVIGPLAFFLFAVLSHKKRWREKKRIWEGIKARGPLISFVVDGEGNESIKWQTKEDQEWCRMQVEKLTE